MSIYVRVEKQVEGPFTVAEIQSQLDQGWITPKTMAWRVGWSEWKTVAEALASPSQTDAAQADNASPAPLPAKIEPAPPSYAPTLVLASARFWPGRTGVCFAVDSPPSGYT